MNQKKQILVTVFNHKENTQAIDHILGFSEHVDVFAVDSGSDLHADEKVYFSKALPNVKYCGMVNATCEYLHENPRYDVVLILTSDVTINDRGTLIEKILEAFQDSSTGLYAPAVNRGGSIHWQMIRHPNNTLRRVLWVDGFCFAMRADLLLELHPIDTDINQIGWGVDIYLAYLAMRMGRKAYVDDSFEVQHKPGPNISYPHHTDDIARAQFNNWFKALGKDSLRFRKFALFNLTKGRFGAWLVAHLPW